MTSPSQDFGRYTLLEQIGSGGMATVYRAILQGEKGFAKVVALKVVREQLAADEQFAAMFLDEARLAAKLSHANVVQTFDFGAVNGRYFIAMEYVQGKTLALRLRERRGLGLARSVHVAAQVARGLGHAHRLQHEGKPLQLVHRDVSPQNVLISAEGEVKLTDFGIARAAMRSHVTQPGKIRGKCAYMAPEQARGQVLDARTDVFALGVVLWESLTGTRLFSGPSDMETLAQVIQKEIPPPSRLLPEAPPELDAVVMAMLARDPARRPENGDVAARMLGDLTLRLARSHEDIDLTEPRGDTLAQQDSVVAPRRSTPAATAPAPPTVGARKWDPAAATVAPQTPPGRPDLPWSDDPSTELTPVRARRWPAVAAAIAGLLALGVGGAWAMRAGQGRAPRLQEPAGALAEPPPDRVDPRRPAEQPEPALVAQPATAPEPAEAPGPAQAGEPAAVAEPAVARAPAAARSRAAPAAAPARAPRATLRLFSRTPGARVTVDGEVLELGLQERIRRARAGPLHLVFTDAAGARCSVHIRLDADETRTLVLGPDARLIEPRSRSAIPVPCE